ncbi:MAG: hypothetical protein P8Z75_11085 [Gammaproteobacteria bacterium]
MTDNISLTLNARPLEIHLTPAAHAALAGRNSPLYAQMELFFSCLIRLKVRFYERNSDSEVSWVPANDKLMVSFRPVMTAQCSNDYEGDEPPLTDFPIAREAPFTPRWLNLDYRQGQWRGEFGYHRSE